MGKAKGLVSLTLILMKNRNSYIQNNKNKLYNNKLLPRYKTVGTLPEILASQLILEFALDDCLRHLNEGLTPLHRTMIDC